MTSDNGQWRYRSWGHVTAHKETVDRLSAFAEPSSPGRKGEVIMPNGKSADFHGWSFKLLDEPGSREGVQTKSTR
jgi:hypothetical protein